MNFLSGLIDGLASEFEGQTLTSEPVAPPAEGPKKCSGMLNKTEVLAFLEACTVLYDRPDVKARLKAAGRAGKEVEAVSMEIQKELFESQGIDGTFGVECLGKISAAFRADRDVMTALMALADREEAALDEGTMSPDDFAAKQRERALMEAQREAASRAMGAMTPAQRAAVMRQQQAMAMALQREFAAVKGFPYQEGMGLSPELQQEFMVFVRQKMAAGPGGHGHSHGDGHGHSHGGVPCHGHGPAAPQAASHGHSHGGEPCHGHGPAAPQAHGHSHGGEPCHGHGPTAPPLESHGHSHGGEPCHGHGAGDDDEPPGLV